MSAYNDSELDESVSVTQWPEARYNRLRRAARYWPEVLLIGMAFGAIIAFVNVLIDGRP